MVTLLGFFFILTNIALLAILMPDLIGPVSFNLYKAWSMRMIVWHDLKGPTWLYYSFAAGLWMYSTMDNVDGKQARRTGTSSGLGELFEYVENWNGGWILLLLTLTDSHGIDSLNCTLGSLLETAAMGLGPSKTGAFTAMIPCLPMFFSTWETYHTHTLYLGYFNGPTGKFRCPRPFKWLVWLTTQRDSF